MLFQFMSHDYSHQSTKEDPRMMAFFDSLVQREIEGWSSEESVSSEVSASGYAETVQDVIPSPSSDSESVRSGNRIKDLYICGSSLVLDIVYEVEVPCVKTLAHLSALIHNIVSVTKIFITF